MQIIIIINVSTYQKNKYLISIKFRMGNKNVKIKKYQYSIRINSNKK